MANWQGVQQGLVSGFNVGRAAGGKLSGLGTVLSKIAGTLTRERETKEAMGQKMNLLGIEGLIKGQIAPAETGGFELPGIGRVSPVQETQSIHDPMTGEKLYDIPKGGKLQPRKIKDTLAIDIKKAVSGEITFNDLRDKYPLKKEKIDQVEAERTPVSKSPTFKKGTGGLVSRGRSLFRSNQAEITPKTQAVIDQIENQADLDEFVERIEEARKAGVDVNAILEYFGKR